MRGGVIDVGRTNEQQTSEDRATQPMGAGGWVSQFILTAFTIVYLRNDIKH